VVLLVVLGVGVGLADGLGLPEAVGEPEGLADLDGVGLPFFCFCLPCPGDLPFVRLAGGSDLPLPPRVPVEDEPRWALPLGGSPFLT
jgi:hypothetical protein